MQTALLILASAAYFALLSGRLNRWRSHAAMMAIERERKRRQGFRLYVFHRKLERLAELTRKRANESAQPRGWDKV